MRPTWRGNLRVGLVSFPVAMYSVEEPGEGISFHRLHGACLAQTKNKVWCPVCETEVANADLVKGYEHAKGQHVVVTEAEIESCKATESSKVLSLTTVTSNPVDPVRIQSTLYLLPQAGAEQAFETIRAALGHQVALGDVVVRDRVWRVALEARSEGFLVYRLRPEAQTRHLANLAPTTVVQAKTSELQLARQLLASLSEFEYEPVVDEYEERLKSIIAARIAGEPVPLPPPVETEPTFSLAEALAASLSAKPATVKAKAPAAKASTAKRKKSA